MTATATDRDTQRRDAVDFNYPAIGGQVFYAGALVVIDSATDFATPCTGVATQKAVGVAQFRLDMTGQANGAQTIRVRRGCWRFANDAAPNNYGLADIGSTVHWLDDATASKAAAAAATGGILRDIDPSGDVWVEI